MSTNIYAGAAKRIITPALGRGTVYLAGFDANQRATGMHDDLYARALALRVASKVVACTHTHSGPDTLGLWGPSRFDSGANPQYQDWLRAQIVEAALEAVADLRPAQLCAGRDEMRAYQAITMRKRCPSAAMPHRC